MKRSSQRRVIVAASIDPPARRRIMWGLSQRLGRWCAFDGQRSRVAMTRRVAEGPAANAREIETHGPNNQGNAQLKGTVTWAQTDSIRWL
jgi:hypothetical protein